MLSLGYAAAGLVAGYAIYAGSGGNAVITACQFCLLIPSCCQSISIPIHAFP